MRKHTISFRNAFAGIVSALSTQVNLKIHLVAGFLAIMLGLFLQISSFEFVSIILVISLVVLSEMINTALEHLADAVTKEHNEYIKMAKDVSAGAVLISAFTSLIVGAIIFLPKIAFLLN